MPLSAIIKADAWRLSSTCATPKPNANNFHLSRVPPAPPSHVRTSQAMQAGRTYTLYSLTVTCPLTHLQWTTHKRYHDFVLFREQLRAFTAFSNTIMVPVVEKLLRIKFPKKQWFQRKSQNVSERAMHLNVFLWSLMEMRTEMCVYRHKHQLHWPLFDRLQACMEAFLEIPDCLCDMELREAQHGDNDDDCVVCTNELHTSPSVELPCGHAFHAECIFDWFSQQPTCPLCRSVTDRVIGLYAPQSVATDDVAL
ncbi:hypothetical protein SDRG_16986 [Saprolegnia diclina VS20]|uniref:RING-type domain-containing protein n=1 Tax=Saprolegnia diclina (strain VS20) TaxID=1156394 RepID=T0PVS8_SAPDV|nr:hypothetical protein SDRG_16986 [Saprolegnia diclina VS20]EQC25130.1 hypothetical protein SDRG_16986 [Saprolegnia diclina VS20]|eukprot:XP_008621441.1 hypothetical protein SDRG_16986 [Saprolegnia diclina VS20]